MTFYEEHIKDTVDNDPVVIELTESVARHERKLLDARGDLANAKMRLAAVLIEKLHAASP